MILLILLLAMLWAIILTFVTSQIVIPMFTDYKFFWIFTYFKLRKKYKQKIDKITEQEMEQELKNSTFKQNK